MKITEDKVPDIELRKNLFAGGLIGAAYGLLYWVRL